MIDLTIILILSIIFWICIVANRNRRDIRTEKISPEIGIPMFIHSLAILWTLICISFFLYSVSTTGQNGLSILVSFVLIGSLWFFPTVGLELIALVTNKLSKS